MSCLGIYLHTFKRNIITQTLSTFTYFLKNTDRNFIGISLQQVLHFDLEVKYYGEHFSKSNYYILVVKFAHSKLLIYVAKKYGADNFEPKSNYLYIVIVYSVLALH